MISFLLPDSLLCARKRAPSVSLEEPDEASTPSDDDLTEQHLEDTYGGEPEGSDDDLAGDTLHVDLGASTSAPNLTGTVADVAARYTAKELKGMLRERGLSASGDKRSLAKQLMDAPLQAD